MPITDPNEFVTVKRVTLGRLIDAWRRAELRTGPIAQASLAREARRIGVSQSGLIDAAERLHLGEMTGPEGKSWFLQDGTEADRGA